MGIVAHIFLILWSLFITVTPLQPSTVVPSKPDVIVSDAEAARLMRYHGTIALRMERYQVYIWRDGKWLPVQPRKETP